MPAVTPAAVHTFCELRMKIGSASTRTAGNSRAKCSAKAQCVVARCPSQQPRFGRKKRARAHGDDAAGGAGDGFDPVDEGRFGPCGIDSGATGQDHGVDGVAGESHDNHSSRHECQCWPGAGLASTPHTAQIRTRRRRSPARKTVHRSWQTVPMAQITLRGNAINTVGELPAVGSPAPAFTLTGGDLGVISSDQFRGKSVLLNIFPSVDTPVCATSVRTFDERAAASGATVLCVSKDLPFAQKRFCGAEGTENVMPASAFRDSFGEDYGVTIADGPMAGLLARAIVVIGADGNVAYTELVPEIAQEPNYEAALAALGA
ncbi:thiol peroxidase [Mycobacterium tuberculosis]|nr:thiol peroxidase [Mycobacterium tuberculosis]CKT15913.1 thiol peroxidase [Mycobacterium tuberculosis]